jgi:hypothetical protein
VFPSHKDAEPLIFDGVLSAAPMEITTAFEVADGLVAQVELEYTTAVTMSPLLKLVEA